MKISRLPATFVTSFAILFALSAAGPDCSAQYSENIPENSDVYFISNGDFNSASNWDNGLAPGLVPLISSPPRPNVYGIDDGFSATFSGGTTTVLGLRVGSGAKQHFVGEIHFGRLTMTGGTLEVLGNASKGAFGTGRERIGNYPVGADYNQNAAVDAADYVIWRDTVGSMSDLRADGDDSGTIDALDYEIWKARYGTVQNGGEIIMTGMSTVRANGVIIGERTKGLLSVGPDAVVDLRDWVTTVEEPEYHFGGSQDIRIGNYGPAFEVFGQPGLDGDGLVDLQGTLNANVMRFSENGAKGELRLRGGTVNLNGELNMTNCLGCFVLPAPSHPDYEVILALLARRSAKVSIIGSSGTFNVGLDPDPLVVDPMPPSRDISANSPTATFSFTADAAGVTPIVVVDNVGETSGFANIAGAKLELNLDAYTSASPLTLINAAPGHLSGEFGEVTFLGSRTATPVYDLINGDVRLTNFQSGAVAKSIAGAVVPEPSGRLIMMLTLGLLLFSWSARPKRQTANLWEYQGVKVRA